MLILKKKFNLVIGHSVVGLGKCENPHGHNLDVRITITAYNFLYKTDDYIIDFSLLKQIYKKYDHAFLISEKNPLLKTFKNQKIFILNREPTMEMLALLFAKHLIQQIKNPNFIDSIKIEISETNENLIILQDTISNLKLYIPYLKEEENDSSS